MLTILTALLIVAALIATAAFLIVRRGRAFAALAAQGIPAQATVTRRFRTNAGGAGSMGRRIGFSYRGPDGQTYERFASLPIGRYAELAEGDVINIVLLPDDPGTSAPAWLVESARAALAKRRLRR